MVALKDLWDLNDIEFVAGRRFTFHGTEYAPGDVLDRDLVKDSRNRESLLRSRRVIPVVEDLNALPRAYQREIKERDLTYNKLKRLDVVPFSTTGKSIDKVQAQLSSKSRWSTAVWASALLSETTAASPRSSLVDWIKAGETPEVNPANLETYVLNASNYDEGEFLEDYVAQDGIDAYA